MLFFLGVSRTTGSTTVVTLSVYLLSLVHNVHGNSKTFAELSEAIFMSALCTGAESSSIDVVFDVYLDESIKNDERVNRGSNSGILFSNIVAGHKVKQWGVFCPHPKAKAMSSSSWPKTGRSNHSEQRFITKSCTIK